MKFIYPSAYLFFSCSKSADVIHSFWVPALSGKTDTIPGLTNETWMEAEKPGVYPGQCTEYCGLEHTETGFLVIAESPDNFSAWRNRQMQSPEPFLRLRCPGMSINRVPILVWATLTASAANMRW